MADDANHDQDAQDDEDRGPTSVTQRPRAFFDVVRLQRFLRQPVPMSRVVGADIRRYQSHFRTLPKHGALANVSVKV